jgi:hypothetical protein
MRRSNVRILESPVDLGPGLPGSREGNARWLIEEEVDIVQDGVGVLLVRPLMRDDDGVRGRIKGHEDCKRPVSVECTSRGDSNLDNTYSVGSSRHHRQ